MVRRWERIGNLISAFGFEMVPVGERNEVWWREVGLNGEHATIISANPEKRYPDLRNIPGLITFYRGPDLMDFQLHQEVIYTDADLAELLKPDSLVKILSSIPRRRYE